ncbi:hypothetical protein HSR122_1341 [Halapricum desulfuricans]|uniref:Uncharacterized protein n=1 Tax=Halapricum desulfuricans TaxID=2841257 RepID=A0A897N8X6_9EURY|nr:hypothetical protein HSR122_1341 [Halapricum desulfuricans]
MLRRHDERYRHSGRDGMTRKPVMVITVRPFRIDRTQSCSRTGKSVQESL